MAKQSDQQKKLTTMRASGDKETWPPRSFSRWVISLGTATPIAVAVFGLFMQYRPEVVVSLIKQPSGSPYHSTITIENIGHVEVKVTQVGAKIINSEHNGKINQFQVLDSDLAFVPGKPFILKRGGDIYNRYYPFRSDEEGMESSALCISVDYEEDYKMYRWKRKIERGFYYDTRNNLWNNYPCEVLHSHLPYLSP